MEMKANVLVVDDDGNLRKLLAHYLRGKGYNVETAPDGMAAISLFTSSKFDVVIMDRIMPRMDGEDLLKSVKMLAPAAVAIMLTGYGSLESAQRLLGKGADAYLLKPLPSIMAVDETIKLCLARRKALMDSITLEKMRRFRLAVSARTAMA